MMSPTRFERRASQRFDFQIPVCIRAADAGCEQPGFTQNLTARGAFLYTELSLEPGTEVELTLVMPAEVTLSDSSRVRCLGRVVRVLPPSCGGKSGLAVQVYRYEYLPGVTDRLMVPVSGTVSPVPGLAR
jgi:hypothetical protein